MDRKLELGANKHHTHCLRGFQKREDTATSDINWERFLNIGFSELKSGCFLVGCLFVCFYSPMSVPTLVYSNKPLISLILIWSNSISKWKLSNLHWNCPLGRDPFSFGYWKSILPPRKCLLVHLSTNCSKLAPGWQEVQLLEGRAEMIDPTTTSGGHGISQAL